MQAIDTNISELVAWSWYHDGGSPLIGTYTIGNSTMVLELDKDFTVGEALEMIESFVIQAIWDKYPHAPEEHEAQYAEVGL